MPPRKLAVTATDDPFTSSVDLIRASASEAPIGAATFHRSPSGDWIPTTWSDLWKEVQHLAAAFRALGLGHGDRLAILSRTCREWQLAEQAGTLAGATIVGIDPQAAGPQVSWILEHAGVSCLVVDGVDNLAKVAPDLRDRLAFVALLTEGSGVHDSTNVHPWKDVIENQPPPSATAAPRPIDPDDPAILIYTSGTTGTPKGIEYTHRQLMIACQAMLDEFPDLRQSNRLVCWLPMAALFQRMINLVGFASRSATYFVEDPREIVARVGEIRPTVFFSVPRFYEKLHDGMREQLRALKGAQKRLVDTALAVGAEWGRSHRQGARPGLMLSLRHRVLDRLVLQRLRSVMGGEIRWMITGSAAAPVWLLEFYQSIGLLLLEAYGITENPVPIAASRPDAYRFGSVGKPFAVNDVRLSADGEVLVKGPALFSGYRGEGRPPERFTPEGYYRTGDYGRFDEGGFLYLTGRAAEIIKTSTGRRISPVAIEGVYRQSRYIDQMVVIGNDRPHLVGLIVPSAAAQAAAADTTRKTTPGKDPSSAVIDVLHADLAAFGSNLARHEQIRAFRILQEPFSVGNGEMTPTLKLRRERIETRHAALIEEMYSQPLEPAAGTDTPR